MGEKNVDRRVQVFEDIWHQNKPKLMAGDVEITSVHKGKPTDMGHILTLVISAQEQKQGLISSVLAIQDQFRLIDKRHYYYPPSSLHISVVGCTRFHDERDAITKSQIEKITGISEQVVKEWEEPIRLLIKGVNVSPTAIFLQVFSQKYALGRFRQCVINALHSAGEQPIEQTDVDYSHMNIMKFTHTDSTKLTRLVEQIECLRNIEIADFYANSIDLAMTDRFQSPSSTQVVRRLKLVSAEA